MKVVEITVHAGRTFNHPYEGYSNFKPGVSLKATLAEGEDPEAAVKELQATAERMAEGQKQQILADLQMIQHRARVSASIATTQRQIAMFEEQLKQLKEEEKNGPPKSLTLYGEENNYEEDHYGDEEDPRD